MLEAVGTKSPTLISLGGQPATHPLGETFYSQVPIRYGDYVAKVSIAPASPSLVDLADKPIVLTGRPDALREEISAVFAAQGGEWELRVQLCTDLETMPIEDAAVVWPEDASPYVPVARISVAPQPAWSAARAAAVDDGLSFSPWHGLAAHQPLGGIMRARKPVYAEIARLRAELNGCPLHEPRDREALPE